MVLAGLALTLAGCGREPSIPPTPLEYITPTAAAPAREYAPPVIGVDIVAPEPAPEPRPEPTPAPAVAAASADRVIPLASGSVAEWLAAAGWPDELRAEAAAVIRCESGGRPSAIGGGTYLGLFQLWPPWFSHYGYSVDDWVDPVTNATVALHLYRDSGWTNWECRP